MQAEDVPPPSDPGWEQLLGLEQSLEAELAAAAAEAQQRVAQARASDAATEPDPDRLEALATERAQAARLQLDAALALLAQQAERQARSLTQAPQALIDQLARQALDAVLQDLAGTAAP